MATEERLIDANAIEYPEYFYTGEKNPDPFTEGFHQGKIDAINDIRALAPTVDAVEVVHAFWISRKYKIACSVCNNSVFLGTSDPLIQKEEKKIYKYCPNCGAKMDGVSDG